MNSLSTISGLYIYTNTPPVAYGTPAPNVAVSVLRAYSYNHKPDHQKTRTMEGMTITSSYWQENYGDYPFGKVTGNWVPSEAFEAYDVKFKMYEIFEEIGCQYNLFATSIEITFCGLAWHCCFQKHYGMIVEV